MPNEKYPTPVYDPMPPEALTMPPFKESQQEYGTSSMPEPNGSEEAIKDLLKNFSVP